MNTIIVTGAGSGLGQEIAIRFAQEGYHLLLAGRTPERLQKTKHIIETNGGQADLLPLDIRRRDEIQKEINRISQTYRIYGLVNNAGVGHFGPFTIMKEEEIQEMMDTNVLGTIYMSQAILPVILEQGEGRLMNIISTAGLRGKVNESIYAASKFAARGFTESLQKEYQGTGIIINAVYMGGMDTPFWAESNHVKDSSSFRLAKEVADLIFQQLNQDTIIIESKKS